jgi:hypothetical protein
MEICDNCGRGVRKPVYAPKNEEERSLVPRHQKCLSKLINDWNRRNTGPIKTYIHTTKAWYGNEARESLKRERCTDEVYFYVNEPFGEMVMRWYHLDQQDIPRLEVFLASMEAIAGLSDVLSALGKISHKKEDLSPEAFCALLEKCGFVDKTPYEK